MIELTLFAVPVVVETVTVERRHEFGVAEHQYTVRHEGITAWEGRMQRMAQLSAEGRNYTAQGLVVWCTHDGVTTTYEMEEVQG